MMGMSRGVLVLFLVGILGIAYLDYVTGKDLAVWGLYLIPVGLASWMGGFRTGLALSAASCLLMYVTGLYGGTVLVGTGFVLLGIFNRFLALLLVSWLASYLFRKQMLESTLESYEECMDYLHVSPKQGMDPETFTPVDEDSGPVTARPNQRR